MTAAPFSIAWLVLIFIESPSHDLHLYATDDADLVFLDALTEQHRVELLHADRGGADEKRTSEHREAVDVVARQELQKCFLGPVELRVELSNQLRLVAPEDLGLYCKSANFVASSTRNVPEPL